jgi:hypothetical protein
MDSIMEIIHINVMSVKTTGLGVWGMKLTLLKPLYVDCRNWFTVLCAFKQIYFK